MFFVFRQLYRVCVVWPWQVMVFVAALFWKRSRPTTSASPCVIITSVIQPTTKPLSYTPVRSVYAPLDRLKQTKETIASVKRLFGKVSIIVAEGSSKLPLELLEDTDIRVVHVGKHWLVRRLVDSRLKSLGEIAMLLALAPTIPKGASWYYKVSGRYILTPKATLTSWEGPGLHGRLLRPKYLSTRAYGFPGYEFWRWRRALWSSLPFALLDYPAEFLLPAYWSGTRVVSHSFLGVEGEDATNGERVID